MPEEEKGAGKGAHDGQHKGEGKGSSSSSAQSHGTSGNQPAVQMQVQPSLTQVSMSPELMQIGAVDSVKNELFKIMTSEKPGFFEQFKECLSKMTEAQLKILELRDFLGSATQNDIANGMGGWGNVAANGDIPTGKTLAQTRIQTRFVVPVPITIYSTFAKDALAVFNYLHTAEHDTFKLEHLQHALSHAALRTSLGEGVLACLSSQGYVIGNAHNKFLIVNTGHDRIMTEYFLPAAMCTEERQELRNFLEVETIKHEDVSNVITLVSVTSNTATDEFAVGIRSFENRLANLIDSASSTVSRKFLMKILYHIIEPVTWSISDPPDDYFSSKKKSVTHARLASDFGNDFGAKLKRAR